MRSDASLDDDIKALEQRIRDRRLALQASLHELSDTATLAKDRVRAKAASPLLWAGAAVLGFVVARVARNMRRKPEPMGYRFQFRREKPVSPTRKVLGGVLSVAAPIAIRLAQRQAVPLISRALHMLARRRDYNRYRTQH
jgi:hypothetical protein